jgi:8-oxo-dGTP pyrophosphatase MutT (NUDIX family)
VPLDLEPLSAALDPAPSPTPAPGDRLAAVLALVITAPPASILFTQRAATLSRHPGEVSFPGGLRDPDDETLAETALRETEEEIGLARSVPRLLGSLPPVHTFVSGILVTPFVGVVESLPTLSVSEAEIADVHTLGVRLLADAEELRTLHREGGRVWEGWWYEVDGVTVWGATGSMLHSLLESIRTEVPWLLEAP